MKRIPKKVLCSRKLDKQVMPCRLGREDVCTITSDGKGTYGEEFMGEDLHCV